MCGICCALSINGVPNIAEVPKDFLQRRGPDSCRERTVSLRNASKQNVTIHFLSTVLSLRGQDVVAQPLVDEQTGTIFCWNGEAWSIDGKAISGNDSLAVFQLLLSVSKETKSLEASQTKASLIRALSLIRGPYAFVFYDACSSLLFYGRDCLGRRSLVQSHDSTGNLIFSSVSSWSTASSHAWTEVGADGIYVIDLSGSADQNGSDTLVPFGTNYPRERIPYTHPETETAFGQLILVSTASLLLEAFAN